MMTATGVVLAKINNGFRINTELLANHPTPKEPSNNSMEPAKPCHSADAAVPVRKGNLDNTVDFTSGRATDMRVNY